MRIRYLIPLMFGVYIVEGTFPLVLGILVLVGFGVPLDGYESESP